MIPTASIFSIVETARWQAPRRRSEYGSGCIQGFDVTAACEVLPALVLRLPALPAS